MEISGEDWERKLDVRLRGFGTGVRYVEKGGET